MKYVYTVALIAALLVLSQAEYQMSPCPPTCRCNGVTTGICTSCYEPFKDITTNCIGCLPGYEYNIMAGRCVELKAGTCPSLCKCE